MNENKIQLQLLKKSFPDKDLNWRIGNVGLRKNGKVWATILPYVDARAIMDRLDEVVGQSNWKDHYKHLDDGVECHLSIRIGSEWVTKVDGSPETKVEAFKGGYSKSLVRAAVKWGIGRGLYDMPIMYAKEVERGTTGAINSPVKPKGSDKTYYLTWIPPKLEGKW